MLEGVLLKCCGLSGAKVCKSCRSRQERSKESSIYLQKSAPIQPRPSLSKFGGDSDAPSEIWKFGPSPKILFEFQNPEV